MDQAIGNSVAQPRLQTLLLSLFALVAVSLAVVGVYGVMAYTVSQRTNEIGVRAALGASQRDVIWMVVSHGLKLTSIGVVLGLGAAVLVTRALETMLFTTDGLHPLTFAAAGALLAAAALAASYIPARRAARVAPIVALGR
jgi:putative ABC transport system permease protein